VFAFTYRHTSAQGGRVTIPSQRRCLARAIVLFCMVVLRSFETVSRAQEPAESQGPHASAASALTPLTSRACAAPDVLLLVFFFSVAAARKAFLVTQKEAYTFVSYAFLSVLEKQQSQRRRHVKPHPQQLWDVSRFGDRAEQGDLERWLYFLHPHVGYRDIAVATLSAHNQRRFEAPTSGFYKKEMAEQWYFQAHGASALHILYMRNDYASAHWISEYAFYELSKRKATENENKRRLGHIA